MRSGRVCLHLQKKGHKVVGIDNSPGAIRLCKRREVRDARLMAFTQIDASLAPIDSVVIFGNNFGLFGHDTRARWLLRRLKSICPVGARIIGQTTHPYSTKNRHQIAHHRRNRKTGRPGGLLRIRILKLVGPWFVYRLFTQTKICSIVKGTG